MSESSLLSIDISGNMIAAVLFGVDRNKLTPLDGHSLYFKDWKQLPIAVNSLLGKFNGSQHKCNVSLGPEYFFFRSLVLPFSDRKQILSVLPYEIQDSLPFPGREYVFDYLLEETVSGKTNVFAALLKKDILNGLLELLGGYGLDPEVLTLSGVTSGNELYRIDQKSCPRFCVLNVNFQNGAFYLFSNDKIRLVRSIPFDTGGKAGFLLLDNGKDVSVEHREQIGLVFEEFCRKVESTLVAAGTEFAGVDDICWHIGGAVGGVDDFRAELLGKLKVDCVKGEQWSELLMSGSDSFRQKSPVGTYDHILAFGSGAQKDSAGFNFRKDEFSRRDESRVFSWPGRKALKISSFVILLVIFGAAVEYFWLNHRNDQLRSGLAEIYIKTVPGTGAVVAPVDKLQSKVNALKKETSADSSGEPELSVLLLLSDISERIRESTEVSFERFVYEKKTIRIKARTDNFNSVDKVKQYLEKSPYFKDVAILSANLSSENDGVRFELKLQM